LFSCCAKYPNLKKVHTAFPPFLNIHSHRKPSGSDEFVIRNAFAHKPPATLPSNYRLSIGLHPWFADKSLVETPEKFEIEAKSACYLAIGECGIDRAAGPNLNTQIAAFRYQIGLANRLNKPLILHLVRSYSDVLQFADAIKVPWIVHGFNGNEQQAKALIDKGARLSFGAAMFKNYKLAAAIVKVPENKLYLETDTNAASIRTIYQFAANARKTTVEHLRKAIWTNFERDFNFTYGQ